MKDRPLLHLTLRVERSSYFQLKRLVESTDSTVSKFLRDLLNRELKTPVIYDHIYMDSANTNDSQINNYIE